MATAEKTRTTRMDDGELFVEYYVPQCEARWVDDPEWGTGWAAVEIDGGGVIDWADTRAEAERIAEEFNWIERD